MNAKTRLFILAAAATALLAPEMATAHPGHGLGQSFAAGVMHPLSGLDHVLMIVAVSAWAGTMSRTARLVVAVGLASFVAIGATLPVAPESGTVLEICLALTVIGSGTLLAFGRSAPLWLAGTLAASFALIHGFAHGAEGSVGSLGYVPGLAVATGGLALAVSSLVARLPSQRGWLRGVGVLGAVIGTTALFTA